MEHEFKIGDRVIERGSNEKGTVEYVDRTGKYGGHVVVSWDRAGRPNIDACKLILETPASPDGVYLQLFHGRTNPNQDMEDWGTDGPVFGPLRYVHNTYKSNIKLGVGDQDEEIWFYEDMVYYDGVHYGDWSVIPAATVEGNRDLRSRLATFDPEKAKLPTKPAPIPSILDLNVFCTGLYPNSGIGLGGQKFAA